MSDVTVEPEGSLRIAVSANGVDAGVDMYFVFSGDWANIYSEAASEAEARTLFVQDMRLALEGLQSEARQDDQTERPSDTESRGA